MEKSVVSKATLGRLPLYLNYLKNLPVGIGEYVSATAVAKALSLGEVQVRKDFAVVSGAGKPKVGYVTKDLIKILEECLGYNSLTSAVLVGAGKLGRALLEYDGFQEYGVRITAGFDNNTETLFFGKKKMKILPMSDFEKYCKKENIKIGIITVGSGSAQQVCDEMIKSGIKAIWNFAPCRLDLPQGILLKQENLALSLAFLNSQITMQ